MSPLTKGYNLCSGETSAINDELLNSSLTYAEMARRLGVKSSTLVMLRRNAFFPNEVSEHFLTRRIKIREKGKRHSFPSNLIFILTRGVQKLGEEKRLE
jgi:hypothetical protein